MKFKAYREKETVTVEAYPESEFQNKKLDSAPKNHPARYINNRIFSIIFLRNGNYINGLYHDGDHIKNAFNALCGRLGGGIVNNVFYRNTNNKKEIQLLKSKKLRPSTNHLTGEKEEGLSVYDRPENVGHDFTYKIKGDIIGYGSDGEPVLDMRTLCPIGDMTDGVDYEYEYRQSVMNGEKIFAEKFEWTNQQLDS